MTAWRFDPWRAAATVWVTTALALPATAGERREAGAHEHGTSELEVALDGGDLAVDLEGPAANFLGFEHAPRDPRERAALDAALAALRDPAQLFRLPAEAGCRLAGGEVNPPEPEADGHGADDHDADHGAHDGHSEMSASWDFRCARPAALATLDAAPLFARFPATTRVEAGVAGPAGQSAATLTAAQPVLRLVR